jgi:CRISPR/Cas system-associated exonuclease Cas4 (RecB family)
MTKELKISRTGIEQYIRCPKCFYMQRRLGLKPPSMVPLTLAVATDALLKNEFDVVRESGLSHPLWKREGLNLRAFQHSDIDQWRSNFKGMRVTHSSGAEIYGAVDDVWENLETNELHIVDYKSTSKKEEPTIDTGFGDSYKRQMEIYQWLFRKAGFKINSIGYFLYVNGKKQGNFYENGTDGVMHFETTLILYKGDDSWVDDAVDAAIKCLTSDTIPNSGIDCDNCRYYLDRSLINDVT